jgi:ketosteroid isomerase-like protein
MEEDMSEETMELVQRGLNAWKHGDFAAMETMLDPNVQWRWYEPGEWDCRNRADVMDVVRVRYEQGFARGEIELIDGGPHRVIVVAHPRDIGGEDWPEETATVMTVQDGKVKEMRDYRTKDDALKAIT